MYKFFISIICVCIFTHNAKAQTKKDITAAVETLTDSISKPHYPKTYGLRIGADIIKPILSFTEDNFRGIEIVADYRLKTHLFVAAETGYTDKKIEEDNFNHTVKGSYIKAGLNYNFFNNWLDMDNELYIGFRYGFGLFSNRLNNYTVFQQGDFFEPRTVNTSTTFNNLTSHWVEAVAGIKVEVFKNVYLGIMINVNKIIATNNPANFKNTYTPGFGAITQNGSGSNINYTISYRIPLFKK